jgi:hypothetical protein
MQVRNWDPDWALAVCRADGQTCQLGSDCCSRACVAATCGPPPSGCVADDNGCTAATECCSPDARCVAGFCSAPR